jgi:hypothetical protein
MKMNRYGMMRSGFTGLCLVCMLVVGAASASNASAAGWLVCLEGKNKEVTKYTSNQCTKAESTGGWESTFPNGGETIKLAVASLRLADTGTLGGTTAIKCNSGMKGWGTVFASNEGEITSAEVANPKTECERLEGLCKSSSEIEKVSAVNLPWKTEIVETESKYSIKILKTGEGTEKEPGWAVKCNTVLGSKTDTCTSEGEANAEKLEATNTSSAGVLLVSGTFEKVHKGKCSEGGKEKGEVSGKVSIEKANGTALSITKGGAVGTDLGACGGTYRPIGSGATIMFTGAETKCLKFRNGGGTATWENETGPDIPGVFTENEAGNFSLARVGTAPCGMALGAGQMCEIFITSAAATKKGKYELIYKSQNVDRTVMFNLMS